MVPKPMDGSQPLAMEEDGSEAARPHFYRLSGGMGSQPLSHPGSNGGQHNGRSSRQQTDDCSREIRSQDRRITLLARALEQDVIPRLARAHRSATAPAVIDRPPGESPTADDIARLTALATRGDPADVEAYVEALRFRGMTLECLYLELLAPVAQRLGAMWEADECDFATVTMGLCALQQVVMNSGRHLVRQPQRSGPFRRAALAPVPGEQHTFGLLMVAEFFRRAGWEIWSGTGGEGTEITTRVKAERFAIAGFSLAHEERLVALAGVIRQVRRASLNRGIGILVGGPLFIAHPELVLQVGADATASDGQQAVLQAETLLALDAARM